MPPRRSREGPDSAGRGGMRGDGVARRSRRRSGAVRRLPGCIGGGRRTARLRNPRRTAASAYGSPPPSPLTTATTGRPRNSSVGSGTTLTRSSGRAATIAHLGAATQLRLPPRRQSVTSGPPTATARAARRLPKGYFRHRYRALSGGRGRTRPISGRRGHHSDRDAGFGGSAGNAGRPAQRRRHTRPQRDRPGHRRRHRPGVRPPAPAVAELGADAGRPVRCGRRGDWRRRDNCTAATRCGRPL